VLFRSAAGERARTVLSLALVSKMALVLGACGVVLWSNRVSPLGFMIGIGAMVLGVIVGGLHESLSSSSNEGSSNEGSAPSESK